MAKLKKFYIGPVPINSISQNKVVDYLSTLAEERNKSNLVFYLNAHSLYLSLKQRRFLKILQEADLVYADGWGVVLAFRLFGVYLPGRLTTKDFFNQFCQSVVKRKKSLFFLGGEKKVIKRMIENLRVEFNQIRIKGWYDGYFLEKEKDSIINKINKVRPDFLIVGMGSPKQEIWLAKNIDKLEIKVGWCVGGLFDFISCNKPSCPLWLGNLGFEWLFRLLTEPKRLWKRYLIGIPGLIYQIIKLKIKKLVKSDIKI